jgi:hypothetical protein
MLLINEDVIHPQLVKHQPIVFLVLGEQVLKPGFAGGFLFLDGLHDVSLGFRGVGPGSVAEQLVVLGDLLAQEAFLEITRHADALEARMRHDDGIPFRGDDLGRQSFAAFLAEIVLACHEQLGVGVELHELAGELL